MSQPNFLHKLFRTKVNEVPASIPAKNYSWHNTLAKSTRGFPNDVMVSGTRYVAGIIRPIYNPTVLVHAVETVPVLQTIISKTTNEVVKNGTDFKPLFKKKCLECDMEYDEDVDKCDCGSKLLKKPDKEQLKGIKKLIRYPNKDKNNYVVKTFMDILKETVYYNKSIDDFYWEIVCAPDGTPVEIWGLPAEDIRIFGDVNVKRFEGSNVQKFCQACYTKEKNYLRDVIYEDNRLNCPECGRPLVETAYVQLVPNGDTIIARWADDEIIHGNSRAFGNRMYGNPPVLAVLNEAMILNWLDIYQRDAYSLNRSPDGILTFPGWDTDELLDMKDKLSRHKALNPSDKTQIWLPTQDAPVYVNTMPKLVDMDAVEMAKYLRENIAICYGVSLNMLGVQTPGKLGDETETVEVSYGTIEETQTQIAEVINTKLLPRFGVRDWKFVFNPPKKDDEMRKAQLIQSYATTITTLRQSGIDAIMSQDMQVAIRGEQPPPKEPSENTGFNPFMQMRKDRVYVDSPKDAPEGANVQQGERGGLYYEDSGSSEESDGTQVNDKPDFESLKGKSVTENEITNALFEYNKKHPLDPNAKENKERQLIVVDGVVKDDYTTTLTMDKNTLSYTSMRDDGENTNRALQDENGDWLPTGTVSLYHTHPEDLSFSAGDWGHFSNWFYGKMTAVSDLYVYEMVKEDKWHNIPREDKSRRKLQESYNKLEDEVFDDIYGTVPDETIANAVIEEVNKRMSEMWGIKYTKTLIIDKNTKSLTPRDIPRSDAIDKIRELENRFAQSLVDKYQKGVDEIIKMAQVRNIPRTQLQGDLDAFTEKFISDSLAQARKFATDAYKLGMESELKSLGVDRSGRFTQIDENALKFLAEEPHSIFNSIKTFGDDTVSQFKSIIEDAYSTEGEFDLSRMVKQMKEVSGGSTSKLERIARSETTKISNFGRAKQWEQHADPNKKEYYWITAKDARVSDLCKAIANGGQAKLWGKPKSFPGNPYTLEEIKHFTADFLPHPNCRSTVVRKPEGGYTKVKPINELRGETS